jgi:hypothetical protein
MFETDSDTGIGLTADIFGHLVPGEKKRRQIRRMMLLEL